MFKKANNIKPQQCHFAHSINSGWYNGPCNNNNVIHQNQEITYDPNVHFDANNLAIDNANVNNNGIINLLAYGIQLTWRYQIYALGIGGLFILTNWN